MFQYTLELGNLVFTKFYLYKHSLSLTSIDLAWEALCLSEMPGVCLHACACRINCLIEV
jgi:hypothetical protein